jgi:hypothetical protein
VALEQRWAADQAEWQRRVATLERQIAQLTMGAVPVTSTTHPLNPSVGMQIFETDTNNTLEWDGAGWRVIQTGAWTSYTAAWAASGTAPSLGNGTLIGSYSKLGRTVHVRIELFGGSGTTWGSGTYSLSLPFTANVAGVPSGQFAHVGTILAAAAGNTTFYTMGALIDQATPGVINGVVNGSGSFWSQGTPATLGTTAQAVASLTYESVS